MASKRSTTIKSKMLKRFRRKKKKSARKPSKSSKKGSRPSKPSMKRQAKLKSTNLDRMKRTTDPTQIKARIEQI